jgi:DNA-3-methyladenine glycosylase
MKILPASFYDRDPAVVAPLLLGKYLVRTYKGKKLVGMISETEAYLPFGDEASHGFKRTKTRDSLYTSAGHAYVYGMRHHFLFNTVTQGEDHPGAVLLRGVLPIEGIETMKVLRGKETQKGLTDGPAKLCKALAIDLREDGIDITQRESEVYIEDRGTVIDPKTIRITPRIGITKAADWLLRFYIET